MSLSFFGKYNFLIFIHQIFSFVHDWLVKNSYDNAKEKAKQNKENDYPKSLAKTNSIEK